MFVGTSLLSRILHKVQPVVLSNGFLEGEGIIPCLYFGIQGVSEVGKIVWRGIGSFFIVDQLGCKTFCLWNNGVGYKHVHRCKEFNETKNLGPALYLLVSFLGYFD